MIEVMMKWSADEDIPRPSIRRLRDEGFDVVAVIDEMPGAKDHEVLARAVAESRVLLTFDRDYGELIYRHGLPCPSGVV